MTQEKTTEVNASHLELDFDNDSDFEKMGNAGKKGLLGRFNSRFNDKLQTSRGQDRQRDVVAETASIPEVKADDLAMRRAKTVTSGSAQRMIIPEGVIIEGSLTSSSDTDIGGRIEGNITVEGRLNLGPSALISGNIRAGSCKIEGLVEGKVECTEDLELGPTGRLNADVLAGKRIYLAGQVYGNVTTPGMLRLAATSRVEGDVRTRSIMVEEGATLNGQCTMRAPSQQQTQQPQKK
ncbi:MAG: polymer-forming cytoskeletal protein [Candidatus Hydrogenedentes bacterium]|nr:polymer-forming cytoskeletal protein [Candidatus Hydrogenedentota bacterium]